MRPRRRLVATPALVRQPGWRAVAGVAAAGLVLGSLLLVLQLVRLGWEPTAPFVVGTSWRLDEELAARHVPVQVTPGNGYDGQWFLGLAYDPLLDERLASSFDMPRYRAGRPLQAVTGWLLAGGRAAAIPFGLLAVGPLAVALGSAATGRLVAASGRSPWWGLGFVAVPGVIVGVTFATAEPLALALAVLGLSMVLERRLVAAGLAFAGAALTKETYLVFAVAAAAWLALEPGTPHRARVARAAVVVVPGVVGLAAWWAYVAARIPAGPGDREAVGAVGPPLAGWGQVLGRLLSGDYVPDAPVGLVGALLLVGSLLAVIVAIPLGLRRRNLVGWTGLLLGVGALMLSGELLGRFLSSMRALAPAVLAAALVIAVRTTTTAGRETEVPAAVGPPPAPR